MKELGEITQLDSITIGGRVFTVTRRGEASEKVQYENPVIFVEYTGKSKDRGQRSTYGGRSQIASIKSVSQIRSYGNTYDLVGDDRWIVTGVYKTYRVEREGKMKKFSNLRQFLKIYPSQHTEAIKEFIDSNAIAFDSVEQVIKLCNYAEYLD